jgi:hypothetical protein
VRIRIRFISFFGSSVGSVTGSVAGSSVGSVTGSVTGALGAPQAKKAPQSRENIISAEKSLFIVISSFIKTVYSRAVKPLSKFSKLT